MKLTSEMNDNELLDWCGTVSQRTLTSIIRDRDQILRERNAYRDALVVIADADDMPAKSWFRNAAKVALKGHW